LALGAKNDARTGPRSMTPPPLVARNPRRCGFRVDCAPLAQPQEPRNPAPASAGVGNAMLRLPPIRLAPSIPVMAF